MRSRPTLLMSCRWARATSSLARRIVHWACWSTDGKPARSSPGKAARRSRSCRSTRPLTGAASVPLPTLRLQPLPTARSAETCAPSSPQLGGCTPAVSGGFCNPQPGDVGNLQQFAFNAPAYFDWNMTASKEFDITAKVKLTFRTDAFNILNHPVFAVPLDGTSGVADFNINSTTFGQATRTVSAPRVLQMQLMLTF